MTATGLTMYAGGGRKVICAAALAAWNTSGDRVVTADTRYVSSFFVSRFFFDERRTSGLAWIYIFSPLSKCGISSILMKTKPAVCGVCLVIRFYWRENVSNGEWRC